MVPRGAKKEAYPSSSAPWAAKAAAFQRAEARREEDKEDQSPLGRVIGSCSSSLANATPASEDEQELKAGTAPDTVQRASPVDSP
jgi:hypothetical protein